MKLSPNPKSNFISQVYIGRHPLSTSGKNELLGGHGFHAVDQVAAENGQVPQVHVGQNRQLVEGGQQDDGEEEGADQDVGNAGVQEGGAEGEPGDLLLGVEELRLGTLRRVRLGGVGGRDKGGNCLTKWLEYSFSRGWVTVKENSCGPL